MMHQMNRSATAGKLEDPAAFAARRSLRRSPAGGLTPCATSMATFSLMKACRVLVYMSRNARSKRLPSRIAVVPAAE